MNESVNSYADIEILTDVESASEHRLIQLLIDRCLQQINIAKSAIIEKNITLKHRSIKNAVDIINYLKNCLNHEDTSAKNLAKQLDELYDFLERCLINATLKNQTDYLEQAQGVLGNIKSGWDGIALNKDGA